MRPIARPFPEFILSVPLISRRLFFSGRLRGLKSAVRQSGGETTLGVPSVPRRHHEAEGLEKALPPGEEGEDFPDRGFVRAVRMPHLNQVFLQFQTAPRPVNAALFLDVEGLQEQTNLLLDAVQFRGDGARIGPYGPDVAPRPRCRRRDLIRAHGDVVRRIFPRCCSAIRGRWSGRALLAQGSGLAQGIAAKMQFSSCRNG